MMQIEFMRPLKGFWVAVRSGLQLLMEVDFMKPSLTLWCSTAGPTRLWGGSIFAKARILM